MKKNILLFLLIISSVYCSGQNLYFGYPIPKPKEVSNESALGYFAQYVEKKDVIMVTWDTSPPTFDSYPFEFLIGLYRYTGPEKGFNSYINASYADIILGFCSAESSSSCFKIGEAMKEKAIKYYGRYTSSTSGSVATTYVWENDNFSVVIEINLILNEVGVMYQSYQ